MSRVLVEPPHPRLSARWPPFALNAIQLGAAAGAATMVLTSNGDLLFLGVLLGVVAAEAVVALGTVAGALAVTVRWGSPSLAALAGNQAVLGPAGATGPFLLSLSSWCAAAAFVLATPAGWPGAVACGVAAATVVVGPSAGGLVVARVAASVVGVVLAWACGRWLPRQITRPAVLALSALALVSALAG